MDVTRIFALITLLGTARIIGIDRRQVENSPALFVVLLDTMIVDQGLFAVKNVEENEEGSSA